MPRGSTCPLLIARGAVKGGLDAVLELAKENSTLVAQTAWGGLGQNQNKQEFAAGFRAGFDQDALERLIYSSEYGRASRRLGHLEYRGHANILVLAMIIILKAMEPIIVDVSLPLQLN